MELGIERAKKRYELVGQLPFCTGRSFLILDIIMFTSNVYLICTYCLFVPGSCFQSICCICRITYQTNACGREGGLEEEFENITGRLWKTGREVDGTFLQPFVPFGVPFLFVTSDTMHPAIPPSFPCASGALGYQWCGRPAKHCEHIFYICTRKTFGYLGYWSFRMRFRYGSGPTDDGMMWKQY